MDEEEKKAEMEAKIYIVVGMWGTFLVVIATVGLLTYLAVNFIYSLLA